MLQVTKKITINTSAALVPVADFIDNVHFLLPFSNRILWHVVYITIMVPRLTAVFKDAASKLVKLRRECNRRLTVMLSQIYADMIGTTRLTVDLTQIRIFCKICKKKISALKQSF